VPDDGAREASPSASLDELVKDKKKKCVEQQERYPNAELVYLQDGISSSSQQKPLIQVARVVTHLVCL
jgi:hypothetical protein